MLLDPVLLCTPEPVLARREQELLRCSHVHSVLLGVRLFSRWVSSNPPVRLHPGY